MTERAGRIVALAAVGMFLAVAVVSSRQPTALAVSVGLGTAAICVILALRSTVGWQLIAGLAVAAVGVAVVCDSNSSSLGWFTLCVLAGWGALNSSTVHTLVLGSGLVAILGAQWLDVRDEPGWAAWIAGTVFTTTVCALARRQRDLIDQLREAQAGLAERTRAEERNRIAGEMHDIIGHALTVSLLHVTSARLALDEDPAEARASLAEAERLSQQSLAEVRQAVGLLREQRTPVATPMPDARQLPELVESLRRAGRSVHLEIDGDLDAMTTTGGLTVYRIAQEALTNVVRHAPAASAWVRLEISPDHTRLTVDNDGGDPPSAHYHEDQTGVGIISMRERAEAVGGQLTAGPAGIGWRVEALLPATDRRLA